MKALLRVVLAGAVIAAAVVVLRHQDNAPSDRRPLEPKASESDPGTPAASERHRDEATQRVALETPQSEQGAATVTGETEAIELAEGTAVVGRVVDGGGTPVDRADVYLEHDGDQLANGHSITDEQGHFTLDTRASGAATLWARKEAVGISEATSLFLPVHGRLEAGDIVLLGVGEIGGRVVLPDGSPVENLSMIARAQSTESGPGLRSGRCTTDREGLFEFHGLALGEFVIERPIARGPHFEGEPRLSTGELDAVLVLRAVRLVARAEDAGRNAIGMTQLTIRDADEGTRVFETIHFGPQDHIVALLSGGHSYGLQAIGAGGERLESVLYLGSHESEREIVLLPATDTELAALVVALMDPEGRPVDALGVTLRDKTGRAAIYLRAPDDLDEGAFRDLPPGRYALVLRPGGRIPGGTDLIIRGDPVEVELGAGRIAHVTLTALRGGHLELDLSGVTPTFAGQKATVLYRRSSAPAEDFARLSLRIEHEGFLTVSSSPELGEVWTTAHPLESGSWLLRVEAQGFRAFESHVNVKSGERARIVVLLEPK